MKQIKWIMLLLAALLLAGVISHALAKSGQCDECGEKTEWILRNVSDTYTGEYYCSVCGAKMTDGTVIDLHQESQPEDPPVSGGQQPELPPTAQKPSEETEPPALPPQTVSETLPPKPATTAAPQQQPAQQKASPADQNKKQTTKSESTV